MNRDQVARSGYCFMFSLMAGLQIEKEGFWPMMLFVLLVVLVVNVLAVAFGRK